MNEKELIAFINDLKKMLQLPKRWSIKAYNILAGFDGASIAEGFESDEESELAIQVYNAMLEMGTLSSKKIADSIIMQHE